MPGDRTLLCQGATQHYRQDRANRIRFWSRSHVKPHSRLETPSCQGEWPWLCHPLTDSHAGHTIKGIVAVIWEPSPAVAQLSLGVDGPEPTKRPCCISSLVQSLLEHGLVATGIGAPASVPSCRADLLPWPTHFTALCLSFPICQMGAVMLMCFSGAVQKRAR